MARVWQVTVAGRATLLVGPTSTQDFNEGIAGAFRVGEESGLDISELSKPLAC